jgi:hypothetical protein
MFGGTTGPGHEIDKQAVWLVFWIVAYGLVAIGLLLATLKSFNRCLGRIDNRLPAEQPFPLAGHHRVGPLHGGPEEGRCRESAAGRHGLWSGGLDPPPSTFAGPLGRPDHALDGLTRA